MHIDSIDLMIFIGGIIINSLCCVAAGSVESDLIFAFCYFAAATLLIYGAEDVEELADAFEFGVAGSGVHFGEGNLAKREAEERSPGRPRRPYRGCRIGVLILERRCSLVGEGERLVVVKLEHLLWEGWVIG